MLNVVHHSPINKSRVHPRGEEPTIPPKTNVGASPPLTHQRWYYNSPINVGAMGEELTKMFYLRSNCTSWLINKRPASAGTVHPSPADLVAVIAWTMILATSGYNNVLTACGSPSGHDCEDAHLNDDEAMARRENTHDAQENVHIHLTHT